MSWYSRLLHNPIFLVLALIGAIMLVLGISYGIGILVVMLVKTLFNFNCIPWYDSSYWLQYTVLGLTIMVIAYNKKIKKGRCL